MNRLELNAYAKVNLGLDVLRRREDGYHELRMIMQTVDLYDILTLEKTDELGISMTCNIERLPCDESNLVCKAAKLMFEEYNLPGGIKMHLEKRIPMAAGMAGGSTDAAAIFNGINELYDLGVSKERLCELGVKVGADVPYCIVGGTALSEGIGEVLTMLPNVPDCVVLIAKPDFDVSTKYVFENLHANSLTYHPDIDAMADAIRAGDLDGVVKVMDNVLETVTEARYTEITAIKTVMKEHGAMRAMMSGSGPTVFGLYENESDAEAAADAIKKQNLAKQVFVSSFYHPVK
ncbi:MAG: 4-(cytidine 5'-diphospho)-2-C-methyl-D-erythritol kinase [Lachnospiraceae bacterium]|nr:4-(cytidine 5'-diphospho)-2-C-methyl-D-erythritol kinase [Lachnospiraceae bacterium]